MYSLSVIIDVFVNLFLEYKLRLVGQERSLDVSWPGTEVITALVQRADGLSIWAATTCRFIREGLFAEEGLLELIGGPTDAPQH